MVFLLSCWGSAALELYMISGVPEIFFACDYRVHIPQLFSSWTRRYFHKHILPLDLFVLQLSHTTNLLHYHLHHKSILQHLSLTPSAPKIADASGCKHERSPRGQERERIRELREKNTLLRITTNIQRTAKTRECATISRRESENIPPYPYTCCIIIHEDGDDACHGPSDASSSREETRGGN